MERKFNPGYENDIPQDQIEKFSSLVPDEIDSVFFCRRGGAPIAFLERGKFRASKAVFLESASPEKIHEAIASIPLEAYSPKEYSGTRQQQAADLRRTADDYEYRWGD